jgi:hypothetical protein
MPLQSGTFRSYNNEHSEFDTIRKTPGIFQRVTQSLFRGATSMFEAPGGQFERFI